MKKIIIIAFSALLSACLPMGGFEIDETGSPESFSVPVIVAGSCGSTGLQDLINQNESALADVVLPDGTRIIRPGSIYTQDVIPTRLNIGIAADGTIVHVACG